MELVKHLKDSYIKWYQGLDDWDRKRVDKKVGAAVIAAGGYLVLLILSLFAFGFAGVFAVLGLSIAVVAFGAVIIGIVELLE